MTEWTLLKRLLDAVHQHSTMIGRLWLTVMVVFRLLVVAVATEDVYADEQEMFVCDTLQPGCANVCYDAFAPISQPRFWVFQIITVSTPSLCFVVYAWHSLAKRPGPGGARPRGGEAREETRQEEEEAFGRSCDSDSCSIKSHRHLGHSLVDVLEAVAPRGAGPAQTRSRPPRDAGGGGGGAGGRSSLSGVLSRYYVCHVCFRAVLELAFVLAQWRLYGMHVAPRFPCAVPPCVQPVDCYVSRPTEKTVFLRFMLAVGVFCVLLNFLELAHLGGKRICLSLRGKRRCRETEYGAVDQESQSVASFSLREVTSTTSLPTLELMVDHQMDWACSTNWPPPRDGVEGLAPPQTDAHRGTLALKGKTHTHKDKASKPRSAEVWI